MEVSQFVLDARDGNLAKVQEALSQAETPDEEELSVALWGACTQGHCEVVSALITSGADLDYMDDTQFTALLWAVESSEPECVKLLLDAGADCNARTGSGASALIMAADLSQPQRDIEIIRALIAAGADVNIVDSQNASALCFAAEAANVEAVELLLEAGAIVNIKDEEGSTPLMRVAQYGPIFSGAESKGGEESDGKTGGEKIDVSVKVAEMLIAKGADVNLVDLEEESALMLAVKEQNRTLVNLLLQSGADKSLTNESGDTAQALGSKQLASCTDEIARQTCEAIVEMCTTGEEEVKTGEKGDATNKRKATIGAGLAKRKRRPAK